MFLSESYAELAPFLPWAYVSAAPGWVRTEELTLPSSQLQSLGEQSLCITGVAGEPALRMMRGEQVLPLVSHEVAWTGKRYFPLPCPFPPVAGRRPVPKVMGAGELSLSLTSCSTPKSGPCTSPRQHLSWWRVHG